MQSRTPVLSIVLAGGEGKRLLPLTLDRAKPAVPFGGKYRLIDFAISNLVNAGFRQVVVLTQYKSHSLDVHISLTWQLSTLLGSYVTTVPAQMRRGPRWFTGSADALFQNMNLVDDARPEHILVFGADHIYRMDPRQMLDFHKESGAGVTVAAIRVPADQGKAFGVIERGGDSSKILAFHEKSPNPPTIPGDEDHVLASMGNYIFDTEVFRDVMDNDAMRDDSRHDIGGDIIPRLVASGDAHVYDYTTNVVPGEDERNQHYWRDVGTIDSYFEAQMDLVQPMPAFDLYNNKWPIYTRGMTEPPAKIADHIEGPSRVSNSILSSGALLMGAEVGHSVVSGDVVIDRATVDQCVLMNGVRVGEGADLRRCIVDKNVVIPPGFSIGHDAAADGERFTISEGGVVTIAKNTMIDAEAIETNLAKLRL